MIQQRNFVTFLLLSLITCGIYTWYFLYTMTWDLYTLVGDDGRTTDPTTVLVLSIVTCGIYTLYWYYTQGNRMKVLADFNNVP